jgi:diacylglycerol kinase family enzyme
MIVNPFSGKKQGLKIAEEAKAKLEKVKGQLSKAYIERKASLASFASQNTLHMQRKLPGQLTYLLLRA